MKTIEETRRELFEREYVQYRQYLKRNKDGSYNEEWVDARWQGFNGALDAVVIELPGQYESRPDSTDHAQEIVLAANCMLDDCRDAITSTNLDLRIK